MIQEKLYDRDGVKIKAKIVLGLDKELLLNHPSSFDGVHTLLFMFVPELELNEELGEWLYKNKNENNFIVLMFTKYTDKEFDELVKLVDAIIEKYPLEKIEKID